MTEHLPAESVVCCSKAIVSNLFIYAFIIHVQWVTYHYGMTHPQAADGGDSLQIWRAAANVTE
jgi:hypothetical protein